MIWIGIGVGAVAMIVIGGCWLAYALLKNFEDS